LKNELGGGMIFTGEVAGAFGGSGNTQTRLALLTKRQHKLERSKKQNEFHLQG
jgi:hypothetical protein